MSDIQFTKTVFISEASIAMQKHLEDLMENGIIDRDAIDTKIWNQFTNSVNEVLRWRDGRLK